MKIQIRKFSFSKLPPLLIGSENGDRPQLWGPPPVVTIAKRIKEDKESAVKARCPDPGQRFALRTGRLCPGPRIWW